MVDHLEKTAPVLLLENRREHLQKWLKEGDAEIAVAEQLIIERKQRAIEIANEIIEIEAALKTLQNIAQEPTDGG